MTSNRGALYYHAAPANGVEAAQVPLAVRDTPPAPAPRDLISNPEHYRGGDVYETIRVIEAWGLGFCLGNVVKYISRAGRKTTDALTDLKKAQWYLNREIARLEATQPQVSAASTVSPGLACTPDK